MIEQVKHNPGASTASEADATALSGSLLAHLSDADPNAPVGDALSGDALAVFSRYNTARRNIGLPPFDMDTSLCEVASLPIAVAHHIGQEPTRGEVTAWSVDAMEDDPHELMAEFDSARATYAATRSIERDAKLATARTLRGHGVAARQLFTLETVENIPGIGSDVARQARAKVTKDNRRAWSALPGRSFHPERTDLIGADELLSFGVDPAVIKGLAKATDDDEIDAAERLAQARKHYAKSGTVEVIDVATGMVSPGQMREKEPPRRLLGHWLYRNQLSEIIARPGGGKTFVALGWGLALASGAAHRTLGVAGGREPCEGALRRRGGT